MDALLFDDLLEEIFHMLPTSCSPSVSLVSRRWLSVLRSSLSSLSLTLPASIPTTWTPSLAAVLSHYPYLSVLTINTNTSGTETTSRSDDVFVAIAAAPCAGRLVTLRFISSPVSLSALLAASPNFSRLSSLHVAAVFPLAFHWLALLPCLKSFALVNNNSSSSLLSSSSPAQNLDDDDHGCSERDVVGLPLERLSLCGIREGDRGLAWLWRRCCNLKWLQLRACDGTGEDEAAFADCLAGLISLELRACRAVSDTILLLAADHCRALASLLVYDGGGRDALRRFIDRRGAALHTLDLRLPLDLHNDHLLAIAADERRGSSSSSDAHSLAALRLQSCCLVTGDGLRSLARSLVGGAIEELALVSCDVVERETGLLTFLSQNMPRLRKLDLSYNETLADKEVVAMLASCRNLVDIRLSGCCCLTGATLLALVKHCGRVLEIVDISRCGGITTGDVEIFAERASRLNHMIVEESKVSPVTKLLASQKSVRIG